MAAAKMLSPPGLRRALATASNLVSLPSGATRSATCVACHHQLPESFSRTSTPWGGGATRAGLDYCRSAADAAPALQPHKASKFVDTPLQAAFYEAKQQPEGVQAVMREFVVEEAEVGKVECNGRGCRPVLLDQERQVSAASPLTEWSTDHDSADVLRSRILHYHNKSVARDRASRGVKPPHFPLDFAHFLDEVWMESLAAEKYFSVALAADDRDPALLVEYAQFAWRSFADEDKAEGLFAQAVELAPQDPDILAAYAHFLWQTDC